MKFNPSSLPVYIQYAIILIVSFIFIFIMDMLTIEVTEMQEYPFDDHQIYMNMVNEGIFDNPDLITPFAFRYGFTELVALIQDFSGLSMYQSFKILMYAGLLGQALLIYALAQKITPNIRASMAILAIVGFAFFNVRYSLFDPIRPDPLAFCFILISILLVFHDKLFIAAIVAIVGLNFREFMVAPLASIGILYLWEFSRNRQAITAFKIIIIGTLSALVIFVPRLVIPISESYLIIRSPMGILTTWLDVLRHLNQVIALASQMLPILLLMTEARWAALKAEAPKLAYQLVPYMLMVVLLSIYGGTDLPRFMSYLIIPQIVLFAIMFRVKLQRWEFIYVLISWFVYYRYWQNFPVEPFAYRDYVGPYFNVITIYSAVHLFIVALSLIGMIYLRRIMEGKENEEVS